MTSKEKLDKINFLCLTHIGDKQDLTEKIRKIISTRNKKESEEWTQNAQQGDGG